MRFEKEKAATPPYPAIDIAGTDTALTMGVMGVMGVLLADLSHDIRTSMNGIVGMLELLRDTELTASQQQYAKIAQQSADTLEELIERVVDLSLIKSGRFQLAQMPFDVRLEMQAACAGKEEQAQSRGLRLHVDLPPSLLLTGDPARVREVVSSLIDIALHFAERGDIVVAMKAEQQAQACRLTLTVRAGVLSQAGEQLAAMLGQPAERAIGALRTQGKSALELVLCTQLARRMGGHIAVVHGADRGHTFQLTLELPAAAHPLSPVRGLIIAEHAAAWKALCSPFSQNGVCIDALDSALDGLNALRQAFAAGTPYRIVMLGERIQGMDAEVLAAAIKGDAASRDVLLGLLCERRETRADRLAQAGFSALLRKDATSDALLPVLTQLWSAAATGRTPPFLSTDTPAAVPADQGFRGRRILVADDNLVNQQVALRMLEKLGCETAVAMDGRQAIEMQHAYRYDLILMDCEMPNLDGFQATVHIRATEERRTPIIALTANTGQGEREQCLAAGMDDFLAKPIRPRLLRETLARWLPAASEAMPVQQTDNGDELETVRDMFGKDFAELAALYRNDSPPRLVALRHAHAAGDGLQVAKVAHALSGSSASIGATALSALCKALETQAKAGAMEEFETRMTVIEAEYKRVSSKLQSLLE